HGKSRRQYQQRVDWSRLPAREPMLRSCGLAASRQASRSASGMSSLASSSASVVPAPMRVPSIPRGTTPRMSTSVSASSSPSLSSGTTSVPPLSNTVLLGSLGSSLRSDGCRSSTLLLVSLTGLAQRAEHLLAADRKRANVGAGRVPDRIRDRSGRRDDRRLAEALRAEVRQVLVGNVEELGDDLRDVGDRRQLVRVERRVERHAARRIEEPVLGE